MWPWNLCILTTLAFIIHLSFEWYIQELSLSSEYSLWHDIFASFDLVNLTWCLTYLLKTLTFAISFILIFPKVPSFILDISHECSKWHDVPVGMIFLPCDPHLSAWPTLQKLNFGYIFLMVFSWLKPSVFHLIVLCSKTFPWLPNFSIFWSWP
jgi:hypothetical protein